MLSSVLVLARELESAGRAVIATDAEGRVIHWCEGAAELYGWPAAEVMGERIVALTPHDEVQAAEIMRTLQGGHPWSGSFEVRNKAGVRFLVNVTDVPVHDSSGRLLGIVGVSSPARGHLGISTE